MLFWEYYFHSDYLKVKFYYHKEKYKKLAKTEIANAPNSVNTTHWHCCRPQESTPLSFKQTPVYACKVKNNESIFGTLRISLSLHLTIWKINLGSCISAIIGTFWQLSSLLLIRKGLKWINVRWISQILFKLTEDHVCTATLNSQH